MTEKLLTFVLQGRNDNYMDDYLYRIETSLDLLARNLERCGQRHRAEILFVDWGSEVPLAQVVRPSALACEILEFIHVPTATARDLMPSGGLYTTLMVNIGVRRAAGRFVMLTDTDNLWPASSVRQLFRLLDGEEAAPFDVNATCFSVKRLQVPWDLTRRRLPVEDWDRYLALSSFGVAHECPEAIAVGGFAGGQLMHRDLWFGLRGYDEGLRRASLWADNDLFLRASQRHPWLDTCGFGVLSYHMEHCSPLRPPSPRPPEKVNPMTYGPDFAVNGEDWGLGGVELARLRAEPAAAATPAAPVPLAGGLAQWQDFLAALDGEQVRPILGRLGLQVVVDGDAGGRVLDGARMEKLVAWLRRSFGAAGVRNDDQHHDVMVALAVFGQTRHPLRVHHFGRLDGLVLWLLCTGCPAAALYLETPWPSGVLDHQPMHPGLLSGLLAMARFRGYTRILTVPPAGMFDPLAAIGADGVELAVIDAATVGEHLAAILAECERRLQPGGMILVHGAAAGTLPAPVDPAFNTIVSPAGVVLRLRPHPSPDVTE